VLCPDRTASGRMNLEKFFVATATRLILQCQPECADWCPTCLREAGMADWEPADDPSQLTPPEPGVLNPGATMQLEFHRLDRASSASSPTDRCEHLAASPAESGQQTLIAVILSAIGQHILGIGHLQRSLD
jgi:hypothetical protein